MSLGSNALRMAFLFPGLGSQYAGMGKNLAEGYEELEHLPHLPLGRADIAAYQAPLLALSSMDALDLIQDRVRWCEVEGSLDSSLSRGHSRRPSRLQ